MKIKLAGPCLCDSRYEGCEHPKPCNGPNSGTGHGPWCAECLPRRFATITASLQSARDLATAYRQLITEHDRLMARRAELILSGVDPGELLMPEVPLPLPGDGDG